MNPKFEKSDYDKLPEDHELILHYKPKFLNRGGEHLVYTVDGHPDIVIKASTYKIKDSVIKMTETGYDESEMQNWAVNQYSEEIETKNTEVRNLRKFFGKDHTLNEKRFLMRVPVTPELLQEIFKNDYFDRSLPKNIDQIREVWTHVIVQEKSDMLDDPNRMSLTYGSFIEDLDIDVDSYNDTTANILSNNTDQIETSDFLELQDY